MEYYVMWASKTLRLSFIGLTVLIDAFAKFCKATLSFVMSIRPHGITRLPLEELSWNLIFDYFLNLSIKFVLLIYDQKNQCFTRKPLIQMAAQSKAWIRGRSIAGIAGSTFASDVDGCLSLASVRFCQVYISVSDWSLVQRSPTVCDVSENDGEASIVRRRWPTGGCCAMENTEDLCTFMIISRWILLRMRNVSDKSCRENQNTHFMFNNFVFRK